MDKLFERFIELNQDKFDDIFADDHEYQDAQRDIGEIEYISCSDPEGLIFEMQYSWCKDNQQEVLDYFFKDSVLFSQVHCTKQDKNILDNIYETYMSQDGLTMEGTYMGKPIHVSCIEFDSKYYCVSILDTLTGDELSSLYK